MALELLHKARRVLQTDNPLWLTVYSDLMTNLMLFFLMLYAVTRMAPEVRAQIMEGLKNRFDEQSRSPVAERAEHVVQEFKEEQTAKGLEQILRNTEMAAVEVNEQRVKVTLKGSALFPSGRAELTPQLKRELADLSRVFALLPNPILVEGHTDNVPITSVDYTSNWELSVARANSVIEFLTAECGLSASRFIAAGYGEYRPVADNATFEGRSQNRRIEINLLRASDAG
jgi:chemotaxis protein MotB